MTGLPWSEQNAADELAGAITSIAGLLAHRPERHDQVIAAVVDQLDGVGVALLETLLVAATAGDG